MALYRVKVAVTYHKEIEVYAPDQDFAIDKAIETCSSWEDVKKVEFMDVGEE